MARQPPVARTRELAVALHDLIWLLARTRDPQAEAELDALPGSELAVMRLLVRRPGLSVGDVARELGLQPSNASAAARSLLTRGLLERRADEGDGRVARLVPTARAQAMRRRREEVWGALLRGQLRRLSPDDVAKLLAAIEPLKALAEELSAHGRPESEARRPQPLSTLTPGLAAASSRAQRPGSARPRSG